MGKDFASGVLMALATREISLGDYLRLARYFTPGWVYHGEAWLTAVRDGFGVEISGLLTETRTGQAVALTPVMSVRKGLFQLTGSPLRGMYTEFAGPLFSREIDEGIKPDALVSQHDCIRRQGASYIEWGEKGNAANSYMDILQGKKYKYTPRQTLVVDIGQGIDKVWSGFESRARNMVRKAEKNGVVARSITPSAVDIDNYYNMLTETFRRQGIRPPHPRSFFQAICNHLFPANQLKFVTAEKDGRVVAGAIFLSHEGRMIYLSGTSTSEGIQLAANSLIQWVAMKQAADTGVTEYDLGGTGNAAIDKFKSSFGGQPLRHHRWVYRSWPVKLAEKGYRLLVDKGWVRLHD